MEENSKHTSDKKVFIITPDELAKLGILDSLTAEIKNKNAEKKLETPTASTSAIKPKKFFKDNTEKILLDLFKQNKVCIKSEDDKVVFKKPRKASNLTEIKDNATITKFPQTVEEEIQIIDNDLSMASSSKDQSAYNISISKSPIIPLNKRKLESKTATNKRGSMSGHADPNKTPEDSSVPEKNLINVISTSLKDKLKKNIFNKGKVSTSEIKFKSVPNLEKIDNVRKHMNTTSSSRSQDLTESVNILKINEQFKNKEATNTISSDKEANECGREKTKNKIVILENIKISGTGELFDKNVLVSRPKTDHNTNVQNQTLTVIQNILETPIEKGFEESKISEKPEIITSKMSLIQDDNNVNIPNMTELLKKNTVEDSASVKPLDVRNNFENIKASSKRTVNSNTITPKKRFLTDKLHASTRIVGLPINLTPQKEISSESEEPVIKKTSSTCDVDKEKPCDTYVQPSAFLVPKKRGRPTKSASSANTDNVDKNVESVEKYKSTTEIKIKDMEEIETLKNNSNLVMNTLVDTLAKQKSLLCDENLNLGALIPKKRCWRSPETVINDDNEQTNDANDAKIVDLEIRNKEEFGPIEANVTKSEGEYNVLKDTYSGVECSSLEISNVEKESSSEVNKDFHLRKKLLKKDYKPNLNQTSMVQTIATPQKRGLLHLTNIDDDEDQTISKPIHGDDYFTVTATDQSQLKNKDDHKGGSELDQEKKNEKSLLKHNADGSEEKKSICEDIGKEKQNQNQTKTKTNSQMVEVNSTEEIPQLQSILSTDLPVKNKFKRPQKKIKLQNNVKNEIITKPDSTIEILDIYNDCDKSTFEENASINTSSANSETHSKLKRGKNSKSEYVAPPEKNIELPMEKSTRGRRHVKINYLELENMFVEDTYLAKQIKNSDKTNTPADTSFNSSDVTPKKKRGRPRKSEITQPEKMEKAELENVPSKLKDGISTASRAEEKNDVDFDKEFEENTNIDTQHSTDIHEKQNIVISEIDSINSIDTIILKNQIISTPVPHDTSFNSSDAMPKKKRGRPRKSEITQPEDKMEVAELKNVPSKPKHASNTASKVAEKNDVTINQESEVKTNIDTQHSTDIDEKNNFIEEKSEVDLVSTITSKDQTIFTPVHLDNTPADTLFNILDVTPKKKKSRPHKNEVTQPGDKIKVAELKSVPSKPKNANNTPSKDEEQNDVVINQESEVKTKVNTQPSTEIDETKNCEEKSEIDSINSIGIITPKEQTISIPVPQDNTPADTSFYSSDATHKKKIGRPRIKSEVTQPEEKMVVAELESVPSEPIDASSTALTAEEKNYVAINQESEVKTNADTQNSKDIDEEKSEINPISSMSAITAKDQTIFAPVPLDNTPADTSFNILDVTLKKKKRKSEITQPEQKIEVAKLKSVPSKPKDASSAASKNEEKHDVAINQESEGNTNADTQHLTEIDETDPINCISTITSKDRTIFTPVLQDNTPADTSSYSSDVTHKKKRGKLRKSEVTQPEEKMVVAELESVPSEPKDASSTALTAEEKNDAAINQESEANTNTDTQNSKDIHENNNDEEKSEINLNSSMSAITAKDQTIFAPMPLDNTPAHSSFNILDVTLKKKNRKSKITQSEEKIEVAKLKSVPSKPKDASSTASKNEEKHDVAISQESEGNTNADTKHSTEIDETDPINSISTTTSKDRTIFTPVPQENTPADTSFYSSDVTHKKKRGRPRKSEINQPEAKMVVAELESVPSESKDASNTASTVEQKNDVAINQESEVKTKQSTDIDETNKVVKEKSEIDPIHSIETSKDQTIFTSVLHDDCLKNKEDNKEISYNTENSVQDLSELALDTTEEQPLLKHTAVENTSTGLNDKPSVCDVSNLLIKDTSKEDNSISDDYNRDESIENETETTCYRKFRRDRIPYRKNVKIPNENRNISLKISNDNSEPPPKKQKSCKPKGENVAPPEKIIELPMEQSTRGRRHVKINYFELENMFDEDSNDFVTNIKKPDKANTQAETSLNSSGTHKKKRGRPRKSDIIEKKLMVEEGESVPSKLQDDSGSGSNKNNFKSSNIQQIEDTNSTSDEANIIKTMAYEPVLQSEVEITLPLDKPETSTTFNQFDPTENSKNIEHEINNKTLDEEVNAIPSTSFENAESVVKKWGRPKKDHSKDIKLMEIESKLESKHSVTNSETENQLDKDSNEEIRFIKKRKRQISSTDEEIIAEPVERQKHVYTGRYAKLIKDVFTAAVLKSDDTEESQNANINIQPRPLGRPKKNVESAFSIDDNGRVTCVPCQIKIPEEEWIDHNENKHSNLSWREGEQVVLLEQPSLLKDKLKPLLKKNGSLNCTKCDTKIKKIQSFISHIEECIGIVLNGNVTCSICNKSMPKKNWLFHKTKHNNLTWRVGEHPLDINNETFVLTTLNALYKAKKPLYCDKCGIVKKSVVGLLSHLGQCGNTDDAKIMCELCGKKVLPVSLPTHIKMVHENIKKEPSNYFEVDLEVSQKRRKAATRAIAKIDEFASDRKVSRTHFIVNMNFEDNDSLTAFINKEFEENSFVKCKISTCAFSSVNILDALSHLKDCSSKLDQRFTCKNCFLTKATEEDIIDHLQKAHNFESKQEDPEYVYNAEDNNAHDLEDEMTLPRPSKRKRYPRTQLCKDASNSKQKPDFIYSVSRGKNNYNHLFSHAFEYAFEFCQKNYNLKNLFGDLKCDESFWNLIEDERLEEYMPQYELSCDVVFKKAKENNFKDEIEFKKYELFEVEQQDVHLTIFCGAPVRCLAWLPTPYQSSNQPQLLAVATSKNFDEKYNQLEHYSETTVIQFWNFGLLQNGQNVTEPKLEFCLGVDNGPVWCMEWCPSGCYDAEESVEGSRRGLLAVAGHSMAVHIYSVPLLAEEQSGLFYKAKPALKLQIVKDDTILKRLIFPTKISWSKISGHSHIAVGYSDGSVALYNLNSPSKLLKFIDKSSADVLMPYKILKTHSHFISAVSFIPIGQGNRWLLTSSFDKNVHLWDLYTDDKISLKKGKLASDVVWLTQWLSFISGGDESTAIGQASAVCNSHREYLYDVHTLSYSISSFTSISMSDWLNAFVHGNETGEIVISLLHQMLYEMSRMRKSNDYRYIIGYSKLIDKILSPEERDTIDEEKKTVLRNNPRQHRQSQEPRDEKSIYRWYEPFDYEEAAEKYGVAFFDTFELHKLTSTYTDSQPARSNLYPLMAINQVSFNPNRQASLFFATGYQIGFVRVSYLKFLEGDEQIRLSKSR